MRVALAASAAIIVGNLKWAVTATEAAVVEMSTAVAAGKSRRRLASNAPA